MAKKKSQQIETISLEHVKKLKDLRRTLGLLQFKFGDRNITKWESFTENLIILFFGEHSNQHRQFNELFGNLKYKDLSAKDFKEKMKDLLTNFINELDLNLRAKSSQQEKSSNIVSPKISLSAIQIATKKLI